MNGTRKIGIWQGGYIGQSPNRTTYYIRRTYSGKRYDVSTKCTTLRAALKQLERFEADPASYKPGGDDRESLILTADLINRFLDWSARPRKEGGKENTPEWVSNQRSALTWWLEYLGGKDLRRLNTVTDILDKLAGTTGRAYKTRVLKTFYAWLREKRLALTVAEDPTFKKVGNPTSSPSETIKAIPSEHYEKARIHAEQLWRDCMDIQAGTNWHVRELFRFAQSGRIEHYFGPQTDVAGVLCTPRHKNGDPQRTPVSKAVMEAAQRLLATVAIFNPAIDYLRYQRGIHEACHKAGIEPFNPGVFRHTGSTYAINQGASLADVATFNQHKSERTTRVFYARTAVPKKVPTLR